MVQLQVSRAFLEETLKLNPKGLTGIGQVKESEMESIPSSSSISKGTAGSSRLMELLVGIAGLTGVGWGHGK